MFWPFRSIPASFGQKENFSRYQFSLKKKKKKKIYSTTTSLYISNQMFTRSIHTSKASILTGSKALSSLQNNHNPKSN